MLPRRTFAQLAAGALALPASRVLGANDRIRLGIIGSGARGQELMKLFTSCPNTEFVGIADIYTRRLDEAGAIAPRAKTYLNYRHLLDDRSIDAVVIATPQHLHCEHFVASLDAGKHVYQEKTMAFTIAHAKRMRAAYRRAGKRAVQIGHQDCSSGQIIDAKTFLDSGNLGKITFIHAHMFRNTPHGKPQWTRPILPDMTAENIIWNDFEGETARHGFDPNRYINWRFYWDYSGGNFYENMCHQLAFWYKVMNLSIPTATTTRGGIYLWKDGREVPDTMAVAMEHSGELLFTWDSGFGNSQLGSSEHVLGDDGTIINGGERDDAIRYVPQKINQPHLTAITGATTTPRNAHMQNFLDCIRTGKQTNCPFELGYRVAVASRLAVDSYRQKRTLTWDPQREDVV